LELTTTGLRQKDRGYLFGGQRLLCLALLFIASQVQAQQFNSDNQWTAPHGVATLIGTFGEEYSALLAVAALLPGWEFNIGITRFEEDREFGTEAHNTGTFYLKHTISQNEAETGGTAILFGTGVNPSHIEQGEVTDTFDSWWVNGVVTFPFRDGAVTWDLLPGAVVNLNQDDQQDVAWGMTYSTRVAVYKVIPQSAIVVEVFGTTGEDHAEPQYRAGVRWESKHLIIAATYSAAFDGSDGAGFELGVMYLTDPKRFLCIGGGC